MTPYWLGWGHPAMEVPTPAPCGIKGRAWGLQISSWWGVLSYDSAGLRLVGSLCGGIYSGFPHIGFIAKIRSLEKGGGHLRCSEFSTEGGLWGRISFFLEGGPPRCIPAAWTPHLLKKPGGCGSPDKIEKLQTALHPKRGKK